MNHAPALPTPLSPSVLFEELREVCCLLDGLAPILDLGLPPSLEEFRGELELALKRPESLRSAENQLDLIEELAEAVWAEPPTAVMPRSLTGDSGLRPADRRRLAESLARLDQLSEHLCRDTEAWHRRCTAAARSAPSAPPRSPA